MTTHSLSEDSLVIALLCSHLALNDRNADRLKPLTLSEWNPLSLRLAESSFARPQALLGRTSEALQDELALDARTADRLERLLERAGQATLELERFANRGIWMATRIDKRYPRRWKERLGSQAPPVLFGAGPIELCDAIGLAVVGSRDVDEDGTECAAELGRRAASAGVTIVSGGARGVDRAGMSGALESDGRAVGVVSDSLDRLARSADSRRFILHGRLTLVSPFHPLAGFQVGNAMARNKLIYGLADAAVVISTSAASGGTWHGAIEQLKAGWIPVFVRTGDGAPAGNLALIDEGAIPLESLPRHDDLLSSLRARAVWHRSRAKDEAIAQLTLLALD